MHVSHTHVLEDLLSHTCIYMHRITDACAEVARERCPVGKDTSLAVPDDKVVEYR